MDFWDITKLLVRRWMIVVPLLVLSAVLATVAMGRVKPDYIATAYVQLVPPIAGETKPGEATVDQRNPWIGLGLQTIGNAAIVTLTDVSVADQLHTAGYSDSYTITMGDRSPLITFEIVGKTPSQAKQTAEQLIDRFNNSIVVLQTSYTVPKADLITSRRLDLGTNVKESNSKVKRAWVAVTGAGLLLTVATTVALDAWLRRRQRRRGGNDQVPGAGQTFIAATPTVPIGMTSTASIAAASAAAERSNGERGPAPSLVPLPNGTNGGPVAGMGAAIGRNSRLDGSNTELTQPINLQIPAASGKSEHEAGREQAVEPADATVVLPRVRPRPVPGAGQGE